GFEVEVLEQRDGLGGLWYFGAKSVGVSQSTNATSSKTFLQFSDFPMDKGVDHFPHHSTYVQYLTNYATTHNILDKIRFKSKVTRLRKQGEGWDVNFEQEGNICAKYFDAVAVCSGLHHKPLMLDEIPGTENYQGVKIHSSLLKTVDQFKDQRVVVVGGGESAADYTHELSKVAAKTYISLRKGVAVLKRWGLGDLPGDYDSTRAKVWLPREFLHDLNVSCRHKDEYSAFKTLYTLIGLPIFLLMLPFAPVKTWNTLSTLWDWKSWVALFKAQPRHGPACGVSLSKACADICSEMPQTEAELQAKTIQVKRTLEWYSGAMHNSQPFTKSPDFLRDIAEGNVEVIPGVVGYKGGKEVEFQGDRVEEIDAIILCTGFQSILPFLETPRLDGRTLYKNVFIPEESTLAFIGFARPNIGAMPPIAEMQARWFAGVLAGKLQLPSTEKMQKISEMDAKLYTQNRQLHAQRLTSLVDYHAYLDELASFIGCQPNLWLLLFKPKVFFAVLFGPFASFQYRVHGYGANPEAVDKAVSDIDASPKERILQHAIVYFILKPCFMLLDKLGFKRFHPVF
ncbi:MAG: NAD(P)-binding domain-containing protein, partial [Prochloraceae cyanobacterium]